MFGYIVTLCCMAGWYYLCRRSGDRNNKKFLFGTTILMTLFYGLRSAETGSDTVSYITMFLEDGSQPVQELWDYMWDEKSPAYVLLEWIFYQILPFPQLWLITTSAFFFIVFAKFLEKNSSDPFFAYFVFFAIFGNFQMTGVRQSCAMAVLFLAFEQMKKKKLIKYLLLIGLAYLFHKSAVVFLPFYFIGKRKTTRYDIPIMFIAVVLIYLNRNDVFDYIKSFTSYDYFEQLHHSEPINFSIMIYGTTLLSLLLCNWLTAQKRKRLYEQYRKITFRQDRKEYEYYKAKSKRSAFRSALNQEIDKDKEQLLYSQYANAMVVASLFMPMVAVNGALRRIVMYFAFFMVLLIPKAFQEFLDEQTRGIVKLLVSAVLIYLLLSGVNGSSYEYHLCF